MNIDQKGTKRIMDDSHGRRNIFSAFFDKITGKNENSSVDDEIMEYLNAEEFNDIAPFQKEMIENILDFDDLLVKDVMTHRTNVRGVELCSPLTDAVSLIIEEGFSRIPVYTEDIDNICGVLFAKDLLGLVFDKKPEEHKISEYIRDVINVPETNSCADLFELFTAKKMQIAVAVDEYGGTAGIVTMEDLLEAIVGNIQMNMTTRKQRSSRLRQICLTALEPHILMMLQRLLVFRYPMIPNMKQWADSL